MSGRIVIFFRAVARYVVILILFILYALPLKGQDDLADSVITERLQMIREIMDMGKVNANRWWYGWLGGYTAATLVQASVLLNNNKLATRQDMALGAVTTFLGAAGQAVTPLGPRYSPEKIKSLPESTRDEKIRKLTEMEKLLEENALREKSGKSWKTHVLYSLANLGSGLITWIGFDRTVWDGLGNFALNTAITETQIFTQPSRAIKDYDNYRRKCSGLAEQNYTRSSLSWSVTVYGGGVAILVNF